ncbi:unnamed protein product [Trifolium pratense]|uniref:Uncharacterized protein n=1 Tax=Trifolium pratense TaxID=57577 RepID=A0ACB0K7V1_TRIPR|nr:unnamed protein product [Trifolium pratense]
MVEIVNFIYVMIIFLSLYHVTKNVVGKSFSNFFLYFFVSFPLHFLFFSFFITTGSGCVQDYDCPQDMCPPGLKAKCFYETCLCAGKMLQ